MTKPGVVNVVIDSAVPQSKVRVSVTVLGEF